MWLRPALLGVNTPWLFTPAQPVEPLSLMVCRLKPPTNEPQGMLAVFRRSPMFLAVELPEVPVEHTSKVGSTSLISVKPFWPSACKDELVPTPAAKPLVLPANMLIAPGVDGPYWSPNMLSLIAKFWA